MNSDLDIRAYNRRAWDKRVELNDRWTQPVTPEQIAAARQGEWQIVLTENLHTRETSAIVLQDVNAPSPAFRPGMTRMRSDTVLDSSPEGDARREWS